MNRTSKIIDTKNLGGSYLYIFNMFLMEYLYYHQSFMVSPDLYRYGIYCQCQDYGGCRMVQAGQDVCWGGSNKAGAQEGPGTNSSDRSRGRSRPYPIHVTPGQWIWNHCRCPFFAVHWRPGVTPNLPEWMSYHNVCHIDLPVHCL